jgi:precorrin-6B methylase 2
MHRSRRLGALLAGALLVATFVNAQTVKKETADFLMTGKIVAIDAASKLITLEGANGEKGVYKVNDATTIMNGNAKIALGGLQAGSRIAINGDNKTGENIATYIEVVEGPDTKK